MQRGSGLTIRAVVFLGFGLVLGLWLFAWYAMTLRIAEVERRTADINARFSTAQETLSEVRMQVLVGAVQLRDALLNPSAERIPDHRQALLETLRGIDSLLSHYVPVADSPAARTGLQHLREELDGYRSTMLEVLASDNRTWRTEAATLLSHRVTPRRDIVLAVSNGVQSLNRAGYIERQNEIAETYRLAQRELWQLLGLALAIGLAIAFVAAAYADTLDRRIRRQLLKDVALTKELQNLSAKLVTAQEEERRLIARELHDEIGQALTAVKVELAHVERVIQGPGSHGVLLSDVRAITDGALQQVRNLSYLLRPPALDEFGLVAALNSYVTSFNKRHDIHTQVIHKDMSQRLSPEMETAVYRIVQEALTNVARHSRASFCTVSLMRSRSSLRVTVEDDGEGFHVGDAALSAGGLGLIGIRERIAHLNGRVFFESTPGRGTSICIELPVSGLHAVDEADGFIPDPAAA
jgi:signal transduction histidine kinase